MNLHISSGPHIHDSMNTRSIMLDVLIALAPTTAAAVYLFGTRAALVLAVSVAACVFFEWLWQKLAKQPIRVGDLSAAVTGLILGLNLPSGVPLWLPVVGAAFAIVLVKQLFGGIGHNFLNPALAARAALLSSWPARMTAFLLPMRAFGASLAPMADAVTAATPLATGEYGLFDLFIGNIPGAMGEVCKAAILLGFAYLLFAKVISWHTPVIFVGTTMVMTWLLGGDGLRAALTGGVLFGAVFMATDYTTTPMTKKGQCIFAAGGGLLVTLIRFFGSYPEGVTYAILLMNIATPLIDKYTKRRVYGEVKANA